MGLNIKNREVEALIDEVARLTGESKTEAVRVAMLERRAKLKPASQEEAERRAAEFRAWWEESIKPHLDPKYIGKSMSKAEREEILGYGPDGV